MFGSLSWSTVKKYLPLFLIIYIPPIILLIVLGGIAGLTDIHIGEFFDDPAQIIGFDSYIGLINNLGVIIWAAAVAVCIFIFIALLRSGVDKDLPRFFLFSGLLTLILLLDDLFLIHEWLAGFTTEFIAPVVFLVLFIILVFRFRKVILETEYFLMIIAVGLFGISFILDFSQSTDITILGGGIRATLEDGCKFLGIISWLTYFGRAGLTALRSRDIS